MKEIDNHHLSNRKWMVRKALFICLKQHDIGKILPAANMSMSAASSMVMRAVPRLARLGRLGSNVGQLASTHPRPPCPCTSLLQLCLGDKTAPWPLHPLVLPITWFCLLTAWMAHWPLEAPKGAHRAPPIPLYVVATPSPSLEGLSRRHHSPF